MTIPLPRWVLSPQPEGSAAAALARELSIPVPLAALAEMPLILPPIGNPLRDEVEETARAERVALRVPVEVEGIRLISDLVEAGDRGATRVVYDAGRAVGRVLATLATCLDPQAIVVGGELAAAGEPLLDGMRDAIERYARPGVSRSLEVKAGVLGDWAEVLGALALVISDTERLRSIGLAGVADETRAPVPA